jgi:hypothetical protein
MLSETGFVKDKIQWLSYFVNFGNFLASCATFKLQKWNSSKELINGFTVADIA